MWCCCTGPPAASPFTEEGERIYEWAQRILQDVDEMMDELSDVRQVPQGTLRVLSVASALVAGWWPRRCRRWPFSTRSWNCVSMSRTGWWI